MTEDKDMSGRARAMIKRYGRAAAQIAEQYAEAHFAAGENETGAFWSAVALTVRKEPALLVDIALGCGKRQ